jgi:hypothetical protein
MVAWPPLGNIGVAAPGNLTLLISLGALPIESLTKIGSVLP